VFTNTVSCHFSGFDKEKVKVAKWAVGLPVEVANAGVDSPALLMTG